MTKHILIVHEGRRDYRCQSCVKSFTRPEQLKRHVHTIHEDQKDKCEYCGNLFRPDYLKTHIYTVHEGHKDYKCEICEQLFSSQKELKSHIKRTHDRWMDHKCEICSKSFAIRSDIHAHILSVHESKKE